MGGGDEVILATKNVPESVDMGTITLAKEQQTRDCRLPAVTVGRRRDLFAMFSQSYRLTGINSPAYHATTMQRFTSMKTLGRTMSHPINITGLVLISLPVGSVWCC